MANALLSPDQDQDDRLNEGQQEYDRRFNDIAKAETDATFNDIVNNNDDLKSAEDNAAESDNPMNYTGSSSSKKPQGNRQKITGFLKKRSGLMGLFAALLIGGGALTTVMGPFGMIFNLMENISLTNDSSSTAMERRFLKVFSNMTNPDNDLFCAESTKNIKCRMGRISNKALVSLQKKGVTAVMADGNDFDGTKKGYPDKNPIMYKFDNGDGTTTNVKVKDLPGFLAQKENRKLAGKILGTGGAFNVRVKAWTGKHITKKLYKKFNIGRNGGLADGKNGGKKTTVQRLNESLEKVRSKIPGMDSADKIMEGIKTKATAHLGKAKKGGAAYLSAVAGCVAIKAPSYIASGVAAVQLMQVMPFFMEYIGGPGSKAKQSAIGSGFTGDDMDAVGTVLTEKIDGKSALDSQVLLAAAGVNTKKAPVPTDIAPGHNILTQPLVIKAAEVEGASAEACNAIMSPTAMYAAMAADLALTAATSATVIGGVVKIVASLAVSVIATEIATAILTGTAEQAIANLAQNDVIPNAKGEVLGDTIGVSASAFFAAGGMSRNLSVLTQSQLAAFNEMTEESQQFQKEIDIASLSPFDTSSRHTFLGSILFNLQTATLTSSSSPNLASFVMNIAKTPFSLFSPTTSAASQFSTAYGGYASDFGLKAEDSENTPCITISGLPCTGLTTTQAAMSTADAIDLVVKEGWVEEVSASESATVDDLLNKGIKEGTPLYEFIETCSNAETGDYLFTAAGCTAEVTPLDRAGASDKTTFETEDGESVSLSDFEDVEDSTGTIKNISALTAMTPFLLDYQIIQSINGEDDETGEAKATGTGDYMGDDFIVYNQCGGSASGEVDWGVGSIPADCTTTCVTASLAMIVANMADSSVTPTTIWQYSGPHTGSAGSNPDNFANEVAGAYGLRAERLGVLTTAEQYKAVFDSGGMILLLGSGPAPFIASPGAHAIVARGITDDGKIRISNPSRYSYAHYGIEGQPATIDVDLNQLISNSSIIEPTWAFYKG